MDKRKFLGKRTYTMKDGVTFDANIYRKSTNRGMTIRVVYGEMEVYISTSTTFSSMDKFVASAYNKFKGRIVNRPFMKENIYVYVLGKKKYFTYDSKYKDHPDYFYLPANTKDPITRYKKLFLEYLKPRVIEIGKRMGRDLSDYIIRTGLFLSYYGVCFPTKKQFKFDYRLFAYKPEIMDSVIIHEIAHTYEIHHNERFYTIVKMYCPDYDKLNSEIDAGRFEGELDNYVF